MARGNAEQALTDLSGPVNLHIDLDVLDSAEFAAVGYPEPHGMAVDQLVALVSEIGGVVSAAICEYAPGTEPVSSEERAITHIAGAINFASPHDET